MNVNQNFLKFLDLNAGPEYFFYQKCANTNMMVLICTIFGPAFPILYFIGLWGLTI